MKKLTHQWKMSFKRDLSGDLGKSFYLAKWLKQIYPEFIFNEKMKTRRFRQPVRSILIFLNL